MSWASLFAALGAGWCAIGSTVAAPPEGINIELLVVRLPEPAGLRLLQKLRSPDTSAEAVREIQKMISRNDAHLIAAMYARGRDGEQVYAETTEELRPGVEHFVPKRISSFAPRPTPELISVGEMLTIVPSSFEVHDAGIRLSATTSIKRDQINLAYSIAHSRLVGIDRYRPRHFNPTHPEHSSTMDGLRIARQTVTAEITTRSGEWRLTGIFKPTIRANDLEFFILRATGTK